MLAEVWTAAVLGCAIRGATYGAHSCPIAIENPENSRVEMNSGIFIRFTSLHRSAVRQIKIWQHLSRFKMSMSLASSKHASLAP